MSHTRELALITSAAQRAGAMLVAEADRPGGPRGAGSKAPIDTEIEALLMAEITAAYPDDHIVSEECGGRAGSNRRAWIIDPQDGTTAFLEGHRESSIAVALVEDDALVLGLVYAPIPGPLTGDTGLLVTWCQGDVLRWNGAPHTPPASTALTAESVALLSARVEGSVRERNAHLMAPASLESCASIATRFALVAIGRADVGYTVRNGLSGWDYAAGQALLQAVGGDVVGPGGKTIGWDGPISDGEHMMMYVGARSRILAQDVASRLDVLLP